MTAPRLAALAWILLPATAFAGWQDDVAAARAACDADPAPCEVVDTLAVRESRAGLWFVQDQRIDQQHLPLLIDRLQTETDPMMRGAIATGVAQLFAESDERWFPAWAHLAAHDPSVQVRSVFITALRRAPLAAAGPGLREALTHEEAATRRDAASIMGRQTEAKAFVDDLIAALGDEDIVVRNTVVRALGHAGDPRAVDAIRAAVTRDDRVSAEAQRALGRLAD